MLAPLLRARATFPTYRQLAAAHPGLGEAVRRHGGLRRWAREFSLGLSNGQEREPYGVADAVSEARRVLRQRGYLPGPNQVRAMGHPRLATYLQLNGGARQFQICHRAELFD